MKGWSKGPRDPSLRTSEPALNNCSGHGAALITMVKVNLGGSKIALIVILDGGEEDGAVSKLGD
jgi:hypothetical protein